MRTSYLLYSGIVIPVVFWVTVIASSVLMGGSNPMALLGGSAGVAGQGLFVAGLVVCAGIGVLFFIGLCRACRQSQMSRSSVILILVYTLLLSGSGILLPNLFPAAWPEVPLALLLAAPFMSWQLWKEKRRMFRTMVLLSLLVMLLGVLALLPQLMAGLPSLSRQLFFMGWTLWILSLSSAFIHLWHHHLRDLETFRRYYLSGH